MFKNRTQAEKKAFVEGVVVASAWAIAVVIFTSKPRTFGPLSWTPTVVGEACSCTH